MPGTGLISTTCKAVYVSMVWQERRGDMTRLSGYGVELAIKSTEYKAKDDTKVEGNEPLRKYLALRKNI